MHYTFINLLMLLLGFTCVQANVRIGITSDALYCGERELAWRIKIAAESLGWTAFVDETAGSQFRHLSPLDWIICLLPDNQFYDTRCPNYLTVFHPFNYLDEERKFLPFYENYDGYLFTIKGIESIKNAFQLQHKTLHSVPFYPSVHNIPYQKVALNNLVTMIPVWSNRLTNKKFKLLYKLLSQTGYVKFYGLHRNADIIRRGYMGSVPFDGVSVIHILQKHGIVLVLHSDVHNQEGIPTSRIFEAAAASTVIISDKNPFVMEHFGDSVFYIDTSVIAEEIHQQISNHLNTIYQNPEAALEMAKRAHQIFTDNFEMSQQLLKIESLNQQIKSMSN